MFQHQPPLQADETTIMRRPSLAALQRLTSFQVRAEAARGLQPKRARLISRLKAHAKRARAAQAPEQRGVVPCLQVSWPRQ